MFGYNITTLIIILAIALLLFGPRRLPELGDSIGKAIRSFKKAHEDPERRLDPGRDSAQRHRGAANRHLPPVPQGGGRGLCLLPPLRRQDEQGVINRSRNGARPRDADHPRRPGVYPLWPGKAAGVRRDAGKVCGQDAPGHHGDDPPVSGSEPLSLSPGADSAAGPGIHLPLLPANRDPGFRLLPQMRPAPQGRSLPAAAPAAGAGAPGRAAPST